MYVGWYVIELIEVHLKPQADETPWIFLPAFFLHKLCRFSVSSKSHSGSSLRMQCASARVL